jgi:hypothetical protein
MQDLLNSLQNIVLKITTSWVQWLTSIISNTQEVEIGRMIVLGQSRKNIIQALISTNMPAWWYQLRSQLMGGIGRRIGVSGQSKKN